MSGVDVLKLMACCIESADLIAKDCGNDPRALLYAQHCREARAAVAELIDRIEDFVAACDEVGATYGVENEAAMREQIACRERLDAALVKVQP